MTLDVRPWGIVVQECVLQCIHILQHGTTLRISKTYLYHSYYTMLEILDKAQVLIVVRTLKLLSCSGQQRRLFRG